MIKYLKMGLLALGLGTTFLNAFDDGPRMYWNAPVGTNIVQAYFWMANGNSLTPENTQVDKDFNTDINIGILGYNRILDVYGHSAIATVVINGGEVSGNFNDISLNSSSGIGDMYFQGVINLTGAPALSPEDFASYKQDLVISLLFGITAPTGSYDNEQALNLGMNRWNMRIGLPIVYTLGDWIPGEITTLEVVPSVWIYGDNDDYTGRSFNLEQDPMYTLEAHITRDITKSIFVSLDYFVQNVGDTFINGIQSASSNTSDSLGLTVGYMVTPQAQFQLRYAKSLNPSYEDNELDAEILQFNLNYFW